MSYIYIYPIRMLRVHKTRPSQTLVGNPLCLGEIRSMQTSRLSQSPLTFQIPSTRVGRSERRSGRDHVLLALVVHVDQLLVYVLSRRGVELLLSATH